MIVLSILFGIWGISMTLQLLKEVLKDYCTLSKFFVLQIVLISSKLQGLTTRSLVWFGVFPCHPPITPLVYGNRTYNTSFVINFLTFFFVPISNKRLFNVTGNGNTEFHCKKII